MRDALLGRRLTSQLLAGQVPRGPEFRASLEGRIVRGPVSGTEHRYALLADWLPSAADEVAHPNAGA